MLMMIVVVVTMIIENTMMLMIMIVMIVFSYNIYPFILPATYKLLFYLHRDAYKKVINQFIGISNIRLNDLINLQDTMDPMSQESIMELHLDTLNDKIKMDLNWVFVNSRLLAVRFMKEMMTFTKIYSEN
jgi:hypothetical protein